MCVTTLFHLLRMGVQVGGLNANRAGAIEEFLSPIDVDFESYKIPGIE